MFLKDFEQDIPERPFKIYWHGRFLRSYKDAEEFRNSVAFFNLFLIEITTSEE